MQAYPYVESELPYWLVLNRCPGVGPAMFNKLLQSTGKLSSWFVHQTPTAELQSMLPMPKAGKLVFDWAGVDKDMAFANTQDCQTIIRTHPLYPKRLMYIPAPPPVLFVKGNAELLDQVQIGMVGSRTPSQEGSRNAFDFAKQLSAWGCIITSGLALGIDGASHEGALKGGSPTIAVLGNGLPAIYPPQHRGLAEKILEQGALVSEIPIHAPPRREHFPRRNRIISGLSYGIIVVEAAQKSGSLITANYAMEQGREVFALPGSIHNPMSKGCHQLIRQGAMCVENAAQVLEVLAPLLTHLHGDASINVNGPISQSSNPSYIQEEIHSQTQDPVEAALLAAITDACTPIDVILDLTGLSPQELSAKLLHLELNGKIRSVPGGVTRLTNR